MSKTIPVHPTTCLCACVFQRSAIIKLTGILDSSTGAVGEVFDISCLASTDSGTLSTIHNVLFDFWNSSQLDGVTIQQLIDGPLDSVPPTAVLGQHYFIQNEAGGISPVWDSRENPKFAGIDDAVFVGKVLTSMPDGDPTQNVPWLHLGKVSGEFADDVYRTFTVGGVPPSSVSLLELGGIASAKLAVSVSWVVLVHMVPLLVYQRHYRRRLSQIRFSILVLWGFLRVAVDRVMSAVLHLKGAPRSPEAGPRGLTKWVPLRVPCLLIFLLVSSTSTFFTLPSHELSIQYRSSVSVIQIIA